MPIEFEVYVQESSIKNTNSNVTTRKWTQGINILTGNLTGYTIEYYVSEKSNGTIERYATKTGTSVSGMSDVAYYYVWATATKGTVTIKSKNYVEVYTSHEHIGYQYKAGGCYSNTSTNCSNTEGKVVWFEDGGDLQNANSIAGKHCNVCNGLISTYNGKKSTNLPKRNIRCLECGAINTFVHAGELGYICNQHVLQNYEFHDGSVVYGASSSYDKSFGTSGTSSSTLTHVPMYPLVCTKSVAPASVQNHNF